MRCTLCLSLDETSSYWLLKLRYYRKLPHIRILLPTKPELCRLRLGTTPFFAMCSNRSDPQPSAPSPYWPLAGSRNRTCLAPEHPSTNTPESPPARTKNEKFKFRSLGDKNTTDINTISVEPDFEDTLTKDTDGWAIVWMPNYAALGAFVLTSSYLRRKTYSTVLLYWYDLSIWVFTS